MYTWLLTHEVLPGKLHEMRAWFLQQDAERKQTSPNYPRVRRYTTVFGSVHQVICEVEQEIVPEEQWEWGWTSGYATIPGEGAQGDFLRLIVPGCSTLRLLKSLEPGVAVRDAVTAADIRYKVVLTHEVLPGKLPAMHAWFRQQDVERAGQDASYVPPRRSTTIFGSVHQVRTEVELAGPPQVFLERGYAEHAAEGAQGELLQLIAPGQSTMQVWKVLI
jgi:hypothetical protein